MACGYRAARLYDALTGEPLLDFKHEASVEGAAFTPDEQHIVTVSQDKTARLWDAATGAPLGEPLPHRWPVTKLAVSGDGRRLLTFAHNQREAALRDLENGGALLQWVSMDAPVFGAAFNRGSTQFALASWGGGAALFDAEGVPSRTMLPVQDRRVRCTTFSPDGRWLAAAAWEGGALLWDTQARGPGPATMRSSRPSDEMVFSPDGRLLAVTSYDIVHLWNLGEMQEGNPWLPQEPSEIAWTLSGDARRLASARMDGTIQVVDAATLRTLATLPAQPGLKSVSLSRDGERLLTVSQGNTARLWLAASAQPFTAARPLPAAARPVAWSGDSRFIALACDDNAVRLLDGTSGEDLGLVLSHPRAVAQAVFNADATFLITASGVEARVWDLGARQLRHTLRHKAGIRHVAAAPAGTRVVVSCGDNTAYTFDAQVWDAATGQAGPSLRATDGMRHAEFSPDGRWIVTAGDDGYGRVWDAASGAPVSAPMRHANEVYWAAFSPDGLRVVTAGQDRTVRVWDAATGEPLNAPLRHERTVTHAAFLPEGRRVVSYGADGWRSWDLPPASGTDAELMLRAQVLSASRIDSGGFTAPLDRTSLSNAWRRLRLGQPPSGAP
jgi:WD40 repeat protein